jgi:hypothetical protein
MPAWSRPLVVGANLPWIEYGQDFGSSAWRPQGGVAQPDLRRRLRSALETLSACGAGIVRWWLLCDGRSGLRVDPAGRLRGLDDSFLVDVDAAVAVLSETGLRALFVLTDFLWFAPPRIVGGVQIGGRRDLVRSRALRADLLDSVFVPIARRYRAEPAIAGWDLLNEPDWATFGLGSFDPRRTVSAQTMRAYLSDLITAFRRERVRQPLSVGMARAGSLSLLSGLDLDLYQVHWYEGQDSLQTLAQGVAARDLARPLLLGEFPTRGATVPTSRILDLAQQAGYSGALAWSLLARDRATDTDACEAALAAWAARTNSGAA